MPYSIRGSQTRIYPGTICQLSMSAWTQVQLSMSTRTQALYLSMPKQWAQFQLVCLTRTSYQCQKGHNLLIYQCQPNGHDLVSNRYQLETLNLSMPNQWARFLTLSISIGSSQLSMPNQCARSSTCLSKQGMITLLQ